MKDSAFVGEAVGTLLVNEELFQEQLAFDLNVSPQLISHYKNNRRKMQRDIAEQSIKAYDNYEYALELANEFTDGLTSSILKGRMIERENRLAIKENTKIEVEEALEMMNKVRLTTPPDMITESELDEIRKVVREDLEARLFIDNFLMTIEKNYPISIKEEIRNLQPVWKSKGWI